MRLALRALQHIARQRLAAALQQFLQARLGVLEFRLRAAVNPARRRRAAATSARAASSPDSICTAPTSASMASARIDSRRNPPVFSSPLPSRSTGPMPISAPMRGQRRGTDQARPQATQGPLIGLRKPAVQLFGNDQAQHGIAQEFQSLVVFALRTAMGQRPQEQLRAAGGALPSTDSSQRMIGGIGNARHAGRVPGRFTQSWRPY